MTTTKVFYSSVLSFNPFALHVRTDLRQTYEGIIEGVTFYPKKEAETLSPRRRQANYLQTPQLSPAGENVYTVLLPDEHQERSCVDDNEFHAAYSQANQGLLGDTAARMGVTLKRKSELYSGYSQVKGFRKAIVSSTTIRSDNKFGRSCIDLSSPSPVPSRGEKTFLCLIRDNFTSMTCPHFLRRKSDETDAFRQLLAYSRADGVRSTKDVVRSDGRGGFRQHGEVGVMCRERSVRQDSTTAASVQFDDVPEFSLGMLGPPNMPQLLQKPIWSADSFALPRISVASPWSWLSHDPSGHMVDAGVSRYYG